MKIYKYILLIKSFFLLISIFIFGYLYFSENNTKLTNIENIVFIVDVSESMKTKDSFSRYSVQISRLKLAKQYIQDFINTYDDYNYGLISFSNKANYLIPSTSNKNIFNNYIKSIRTYITGNGEEGIIHKGINEFVKNTEKQSIGILISDFNNFNKNKLHNKISKSNFNFSQINFISLNKNIENIGVNSIQVANNYDSLNKDSYVKNINNLGTQKENKKTLEIIGVFTSLLGL